MSQTGKTAYKPDLVSPPGETVLELLNMHGLSQADFADLIGTPRNIITEIIRGNKAITPENALKFERAFGVPVTFWLTRESQYRAYSGSAGLKLAD
jgi:HTH-type transcriptional regulator / antitoxin HigA